MSLGIYALLIIQICGMVAGQLLTKEGVNRLGEFTLSTLPQAAVSPWLWGGAFVYIAASALWLWLLSKGEFSVLVPFQSLSMVITVIIGAALFGESISVMRWVGIALMAAGAFIISK